MNATNYTKIALFFIVLGVTGGAFIISSTDSLSGFNTNEYETVVEDATGLSTRSKIYQSGVVVGKIKDISLRENEAVLRIAIHKDMPVRKDTVLSRKMSSMLGTAMLTLEPGNPSSPILPPGGRIYAAREAGDINAVISSVTDISEKVSDILKEFQQNQMALLAISLETFNSIAQKIDANTDAELERISRILEALAMITEQVSMGRGNVGQAFFDDRLYSNLLSTTERIEIAVIKLQETLETINTAAASADTVINNANVIVEKAIGLGIQLDTYGSYFMQDSQVQAGAAIRLVPSSNDRWYKIGVSSAPNGKMTRRVTEIYDPYGVLMSYEDTNETNYSTFLIDAEIARQFGILAVRGGLMENTGGLGLDVQPLKWLLVSADVFNFKSGEPPNLRGTLTFFPFFDPDSDKPWNWLYLKGGVNNSLSPSRNIFLGGGMRFSDREIKGLVGLLPAIN